MDPLEIFDSTSATGAARVLIFALSRHADDDGLVTTVNREQLMEEARLTKSGFQLAIRWLRDHGEVEYLAGCGRRRSRYRVRVGGAA